MTRKLRGNVLISISASAGIRGGPESCERILIIQIGPRYDPDITSVKA
jgi:hypothetical protein